MPKRRPILLLLALALIIALASFLCCDTTSPDAKYRAWVRTKGWAERLRLAEMKWPAPIVRLLRFQQLRIKCESKTVLQEEALVCSGYLVYLRIDAANLDAEVIRSFNRLRSDVPPDDREVCFFRCSDHVLILCRSNLAALCRKALNITNSDIARPSTFDLRPSTPK